MNVRRPVALVSGGGTGIGRATALALARDGHVLAICGRREETLHQTRELIEQLGGHCYVQPCDVREPDQVEALVDDVVARLGSIDVLVNNAGGQFQADAETISLNGWRAVHRLSLEAVWSMTHTVAVRSMIPNRRGVLLFVGFSPRRGQPGFAPPPRRGPASRTSRPRWPWSGRATASARSASRPARSPPRASSSTGPTPIAEWAAQVPLGRLAGRRTSPRCWPSSRRRARATSRAPRGRSTAASTPGASARPRRPRVQSLPPGEAGVALLLEGLHGLGGVRGAASAP